MLVIYTFHLPAASGQTERWDTYMAKMGNMPASVLVNLGLIEIAPDRRFPFLVITGPKTKNCTTMGLPDKEEIGVLEEILTATGNFITGVTPKVLAGTVTRNCERLNYYYVKDTTGIRTALNRMYTRSFKNYAYVIGVKADPDWNSYRNFLFPDEETRNWMENDRILTAMLQAGDSLKGERQIDFLLSFRSDSDRSGLGKFAISRGYTVTNSTGNTVPGAPFEVVVAERSVLKTDSINRRSMELKMSARNHNGYYDGWSAKAPAVR